MLSLVAVTCAAGLPLSDATLPLGAAEAGKATRADASFDQGRKLLRPKAALAADRLWRAINDAGGPDPDQHAAFLLADGQETLAPADDGIGPRSRDEHRPAWLALRAGHARAPPTTRDRSRPIA